MVDAGGVDEVARLDRVGLRLLSGWLSARRDLQAHLDLFTAFGPVAEQHVRRNIELVTELEEAAHRAFGQYRAHLALQATRPRES